MTPQFDPRPARVLAALAAAGVATLASATQAKAATHHHRHKFATDFAALSTHAPAPVQFVSANGLNLLQATFPGHTGADSAQSRADGLLAKMIAAGNSIATLPYVWGGGHGSFQAAGYDCSGSVSFVLHAAGLLSVPLDSNGFESYGVPGPGKYVTIYANSEHAWMTIKDRRYDTIALQETGTRWSDAMMPTSGYIAVHPAGL